MYWFLGNLFYGGGSQLKHHKLLCFVGCARCNTYSRVEESIQAFSVTGIFSLRRHASTQPRQTAGEKAAHQTRPEEHIPGSHVQI